MAWVRGRGQYGSAGLYLAYTWYVGIGVAPLDAIAPCSKKLGLNGPSGAAMECAGCPISPPA